MTFSTKLFNENTVNLIEPEYQVYFGEMSTRHHALGEFEVGYSRDNDLNVLTLGELEMLRISATHHYLWSIKGEGYIVGEGGPGWFSFGIGDNLSSASPKYFVDGSVLALLSETDILEIELVRSN